MPGPRPHEAGGGIGGKRDMELTEIVLHVDESPRFAARLGIALALARRHDARVVGVFVQPPPPVYDIEMPSRILDDFLAQLADTRRAATAEVEKAFRAQLDAAGVASEWRVHDGDPATALAVSSRYADIAVVSQAPPDSAAAVDPDAVPEGVILAASGPVLVVPHYGTYEKVGEHVLVAWDASAAAARAVRDALPLLAKAAKVTVLSVNPEKSYARHGEMPGADIALHLARHGVPPETSVSYSDEIGVGDMILSRLADLGADLMVMGAYGHSRMRELLLGGVTRHILAHMTAPVLMSR
jgi:nucleotide-binding universal stress UspA family protein